MADPESQTEPEARRARSGLTQASVTSALAMIISIFALAVSLFEANTQRVQQRASVWPFVELDQRFTADGYAIEVVNKGVGPALIRSIDLRLDGVPVTSLDQMIVDAIGEENAFSYELYRTSNPTGGVMSPGERDQLFAVPWEARSRLLANELSQRGSVSICYCSIFNECWNVALGAEDQPEPVQRCDTD